MFYRLEPNLYTLESDDTIVIRYKWYENKDEDKSNKWSNNVFNTVPSTSNQDIITDIEVRINANN